MDMVTKDATATSRYVVYVLHLLTVVQVLSFVASSIASSKSTLKTIFSPLDSECLACVCVAVCVCVCLLKVMRKLLNEGLCVYVISKVHCALGWVYILLTLLLLYCVLWAHVGCKHLTNTLLHYIDKGAYLKN